MRIKNIINSASIISVGMLTIFLLSTCVDKTRAIGRKSEIIIFLSNRDAPKRQFDIFSMKLDGREPLNLTRNIDGVQSISAPTISPDGEEIVFIRFADNENLLQSMDLNSDDSQVLTELNHDVPDIQFSPDGRRIFFVDKVDQRRQIFMINKDGSDRINLSNNQLDEFDPCLSPDGRDIVFISQNKGNYSVTIMTIAGFKRRILIENGSEFRYPAFSPDGSLITFTSVLDGNGDIYVMNSSGGESKKIFESPSFETNPVFAPDGKTMAFLSNSRGMKFRDIFVHNFETGHVKNLTGKLNSINQNASFTTDSKRLIFESVQFGNSDLYSISIIGDSLINLTNHPKWDITPAL